MITRSNEKRKKTKPERRTVEIEAIMIETEIRGKVIVTIPAGIQITDATIEINTRVKIKREAKIGVKIKTLRNMKRKRLRAKKRKRARPTLI